jgi:hypothetical protein
LVYASTLYFHFHINNTSLPIKFNSISFKLLYLILSLYTGCSCHLRQMKRLVLSVLVWKLVDNNASLISSLNVCDIAI